MTKLKKTRTLWFFKLYRDQDGQRYYRIGDGNFRRFKIWPSRWYSRLAAILFILAMLGWAAYKPALHYAADVLINQVADKLLTEEEINEIANSPEFKQILEEQINLGNIDLVAPAATASATVAPSDTKPSASKPEQDTKTQDTKTIPESPTATPPTTRFANNDEALEFMLSKFSMSELTSLANKARGGLTSEEKEEIKSVLHQRLSSEEYQAIKILAVLEIQKRQVNLSTGAGIEGSS